MVQNNMKNPNLNLDPIYIPTKSISPPNLAPPPPPPPPGPSAGGP